MPKVNRDEFDLDVNGNKKQALQKGLITKNGDVSRLISDFSSQAAAIHKGFSKLAGGKDYTAGEDALTNLMTLLSGGPQVKFYDQYKNLLSDPQKANAFESSNDEKLSTGERLAMTDFYRVMDATKNLRDELLRVLKNYVSPLILPAYQVMRLQNKMFQNIKSYTVEEISNAFSEFDSIMIKYSSPKVYEFMVINRKFYSVSDATDVVLDYMGVDIEDTNYLCDYLRNARQINASGMNFLYSLDRDVLELSRLAAKKDEIRNAANKGRDLLEQLEALYGKSTSDTMPYLDSLKDIIIMAFAVFKSAFNEIDYFETEKSQAPYSIVHPEKNGIRENVLGYALGSIGDMIKEGSNYCGLFRMMITRLKRKAGDIAAKAPD